MLQQFNLWLHGLGLLNAPSIAAASSLPSVAIIGAGAAGASSAYHLANYTDNVNITIFEKNNYVGGRTHVTEIDGEMYELGASMYVQKNKILVDAVKEFNLSTEPNIAQKSVKDDRALAVWDGQEITFQLKYSFFLWNAFEMLRAFGLAPLFASRLKDQVVGRFSDLYDLELPWISLEDAVDIVGLTEYVQTSGRAWLTNSSISDNYQTNFVQGLTRVNYAIDLDDIHALAAAVCLEAENGAFSVNGGNFQIFEKMIEKSNAELKLDTAVKSIAKYGSQWIIDGQAFDYLVLTGPLKYTDIVFGLEIQVPDVEYVTLHVTYVQLRKPMNGTDYFGTDKTYSGVLTTVQPPFKAPPFNSIGHSGVSKSGHHIYKLFSYSELPDDGLIDIFGVDDQDLVDVQRKVWHSYPYMTPNFEFADIEVDENLFYTGGMDPFLSTMETNAMAGKNVAQLIAQRIQQRDEKFIVQGP